MIARDSYSCITEIHLKKKLKAGTFAPTNFEDFEMEVKYDLWR